MSPPLYRHPSSAPSSPIQQLPAELLFSILKNLHPAAVWLLCRRVSRTWKALVEVSITRCYEHYAETMRAERDRVNKILPSDSPLGAFGARLHADAIVVEIGWTFGADDPFNILPLALRFKSVEFGGSGEKLGGIVTFTAEAEGWVHGTCLSIERITPVLYSGFADSPSYPGHRPPPLPLTSIPNVERCCKVTKHSICFGGFELDFRFFVFNEILVIHVDTVRVPIRHLFLFQGPKIALKSVDSLFTARLLSPIFNWPSDERRTRVEEIIVGRKIIRLLNWCEVCMVARKDVECEMNRCMICCFRDGVCRRHLTMGRA